MITASASTTAASARLSVVKRGNRRLAQVSSCSLENATFEPQNEIEPMIAANTIGISASSGMSSALAELDERDQRDRAAADAVEQRHHLRHRGHLHVARRGDADRRADGDADDDQAQSPIAVVEQRPDSAIAMPTAATCVAAHRRARAAHHAQADR